MTQLSTLNTTILTALPPFRAVQLFTLVPFIPNYGKKSAKKPRKYPSSGYQATFSAYQPERHKKLNQYIQDKNPTLSEFITHLFQVSPYAKLYHSENVIQKVLKDFKYDSKNIISHLGDGKQTLAFEISDGIALRVMTKRPQRSYNSNVDLPILREKTVLTSEGSLWIECQPVADIEVSKAERRKFIEKLSQQNLYPLQDYSTKGQIGYYQNKLYLIDRDAVVEKKLANAKSILIAGACHQLSNWFGVDSIYELPIYSYYRKFKIFKINALKKKSPY